MANTSFYEQEPIYFYICRFLFGEEISKKDKDLIYGEDRESDEPEWGKNSELQILLHGREGKVKIESKYGEAWFITEMFYY